MIRRPPRSTRVRSSAASDVYKRQTPDGVMNSIMLNAYDASGSSAINRCMISVFEPIKSTLGMGTVASPGLADGDAVSPAFPEPPPPHPCREKMRAQPTTNRLTDVFDGYMVGPLDMLDRFE